MKSSLIILVANLVWGSFQINTQESFVSYTGYHPLHDWTGLSYQLVLETNCTSVSTNCEALFNIPINSFNSGNSNRDSNMIYHLNALKYPNVNIKFNNINIFNNLAINGSKIIDGEINFNNKKQSQKIPLNISNNDSLLIVSSEFYIDLDKFDIKRPSLLLIPMKNEVKINVSIKGFFTD